MLVILTLELTCKPQWTLIGHNSKAEQLTSVKVSWK